MCGLVGVAGFIGPKEEDVFKEMLIVDQLRGQDSTGVAFITREDDVFMSKEIGSPTFLLDTKSFERNLKRFNKVMIGHNRFATQGAVNRKNAHPFDFDTLVGAHNGTLRNKHKLDDAAQFVVDSENLFHHIEKKGLRDALDIIDGAYALVWFDKLTGKLNFLRNKERTLFMARSEDSKTLFWASEEWMISAICSRNGLKVSAPIPLVINMHYQFSFEKYGAIDVMEVKEEAAKFVPVVYQVQTNNNTRTNNGVTQYNQVQQQQWGRVVPMVKPSKDTGEGKALAASSSVSVELVEAYSNKKDVEFEIAGKGRDRNGAHFLMLMDPKEPSASVRLYVKKSNELLDKIGEVITGDVGGFHSIKGEGGFFKVIPSSVVLVDTDAPFDQFFRNCKGDQLTAEEWEKQYPRCLWCSDKLNALDIGNRLVKSQNSCLCPTCASDTEVTGYVNLDKVFD